MASNSSLLVSLLFADLLSLHLATFLMLFSLVNMLERKWL